MSDEYLVPRNGLTGSAKSMEAARGAMETELERQALAGDGAAGPIGDPDDPGPSDDQAGGRRGGGRRGRGAVQLARDAMDEERLIADDGGTVYRWNGQHWVGHTKFGALALAYQLGARGSSSSREEMVKFWQAAGHIPGHLWRRLGDDEVAVGNGVLNIRTGDLRPHDPDDLLDRVIPHNYDPAATCDFWFECLERWFGDLTDDRIGALQEFFGYTVASHAKFKKALFLYGPGGTGKSRVAEALSAMVGRAYCCSIPLDMLDDPKRVAPIKGKSLNVVTELPNGALVRDGAFKALVSTEEPIMIDDKYKTIETYVPTAKHVIATNTLPAIADRSDATFNRLLIITMDRRMAELAGDQAMTAQEIDERIAAEASGLLNWAIEGLRRLVARKGEFTPPSSSAELLSRYRVEQNPVEQFVAERCRRVVKLPGDRKRGTPTDRFVAEFNRWNKGGRPWSKTRVGRTLNEMGLEGVRVEPVKYRGANIRTVVGLEIIPDSEFPDELDVAETADGFEGFQPRPAAPDERAV